MARYASVFYGVVLFASSVSAEVQPHHSSGVVRAENHVILSSERFGQLIEQNIKEGETAVQGQILGRFDCLVEAAAVEVAEVELQQAKTELHRQRALSTRGATGHAEVTLADQKVRLNESRLALEHSKTKSCEIITPFTGIVVDWKSPEFATVQSGEPLVEIADTSSLFVELLLPLIWIEKVSEGQRVRFHPEHLGLELPAEIDLISPLVDAASQTVEVRATLESWPVSLKVGSAGTVTFIDQQ